MWEDHRDIHIGIKERVKEGIRSREGRAERKN